MDIAGNLEELLKNLQLQDFCPKPFFNVFFLSYTCEWSKFIIQDLQELSKEYENKTKLRFIAFEGIKDLINKPIDNFHLPEYLFKLVQEFIDNVKEKNFTMYPSEVLATCIKIQLLEAMYEQYTIEVNENLKQQKLEKELNDLLKEPHKVESKNKKGGSSVKSDKKLPLKSSSRKLTNLGGLNTFAEDKTKFTLKPNEIIPDTDLYNHISYYVFTGYMDPEIFKILTEFKVPIDGVIRANQTIRPLVYDSRIESFWNKLEEYFHGCRSLSVLEDTIQMEFTLDPLDLKRNLQQFVHLLRSVCEIKLNHLNYIKNLNLHKPKETFNELSVECLNVYNKNMRKIPPERANVLQILAKLLLEVEFRARVSENRSQNDCIYNVFHKEQSIQPQITFNDSFEARENDLLNIILNSYKKIGANIYESSMQILKTLLKKFPNQSTIPEYTHRHDKNPSDVFNSQDYTSLKHLTHLLLINYTKSANHEPISRTEMNKNLTIYSEYIDWRSSNLFNHKFNCENLYNPSSLNYNWAEPLSSSLLLQELFKAQQEFLYCNEVFSQQTDTQLVYFHNELDTFGMNVRLFNESLRTPICLRDFCRYVTVEDGKWLMENYQKVQSKTFDLNEICSGVLKIKHLDLYSEFHYLLNSEGDYSNVDEEKVEELKRTMETLKNYPKSEKLKEFCTESDSPFVGYDLSTNFLKLTGARSVFCSHDGVKIVVDNSRWLYEPPRCVVKVETDDLCLVVHSREDLAVDKKFGFHFHLKQDVILSFQYGKTEEEFVFDGSSSSCSTVASSSSTHLDSLENLTEKHLKIINKEEFKEKFLSEEVDNLAVKDSDLFFKSLRRAKEENMEMYKIVETTKYLTPLQNKNNQIPIQNVIKNFVKDKIQLGNPSKLYVLQNDKLVQKKHVFDYGISFPNNLYITPFISTVNNNLYDIKQEYLDEKSKFNQEQFRLFTRSGHILIRLPNTIKILTSNGEIIHFENGICEKTFDNTCPKDLNTYRKYLNSIFFPNDLGANFISRRSHLTSKKRSLSQECIDLLEDFHLVYRKCTRIKFDGVCYTLEKNQLKQRQQCYIIEQQDFLTKRINFERSDGFRCVLHETGMQVICFDDGTRITSEFVIENVYDYVLVTMRYKFEHEKYKTVMLDELENLDICLHDEVIFRNFPNHSFRIKTGESVNSYLNFNKIVVEKSCNQCEGKFRCSINIDKFFNGNWCPNEEFVRVTDSYEKEFVASFVGDCKRKEKFVETALNAYKCNHYKRVNYKKIFAINRRLLGELYWSESMIENKKQEFETDKSSLMRRMNNEGKNVLEFRRFYRSDSLNYSTISHLLEKLNNMDLYKMIKVFELFLENKIRKEEVRRKVEDLIDWVKKCEMYKNWYKIFSMPKTFKCDCKPKRKKLSRDVEAARKESMKYKEMILKKIIRPYFPLTNPY